MTCSKRVSIVAPTNSTNNIGISMEGGCYPRGGSEMLARELVPVIQSFGGRVLIRALVDSIIVKGKSPVLIVSNSKIIACDHFRW